MSNIPDKEVVDWLDIAKALGPGILTAILALITKPFIERGKIDSLRKSLLTAMRFKMAYEVAGTLPEKKKDVKKDDYVEICATKLNEYFSSNPELVVDFLRSNQIYRSYIRRFKFFKYGIVVISILTLTSGFIVFLNHREILTTNIFCYVLGGIAVLFLALWYLKEQRKDSFIDLCSKYEVTE